MPPVVLGTLAALEINNNAMLATFAYSSTLAHFARAFLLSLAHSNSLARHRFIALCKAVKLDFCFSATLIMAIK